MPPVLHDVKRSIIATATELETAQAELAKLQRGSWPQAQKGRLQKARTFVERKRLLRTPSTIVYPAVGTIVALVAGSIAAYGNDAPTVGAALLGAGLGVGWGVPLISAAISKLAKVQENWRKKFMLEPKELRKPIQRFARATGNDRLQVGYGVERLLEALHEAQLLSPEAVRSLQLVVDENKTATPQAHADAGRYMTLARQLAEPISTASIQALEQALRQVSADDRPIYAQAVYDLAFADRRRIAATSYGDRNRLLQVLTECGAHPVLETGA